MATWINQAHALEQRFGIPSGLYVALIRQESGGNPNARSPVGAIGYAQLMPGTARGLGVNPHDPAQNLLGGAKYLSQQLRRYGGDIDRTLAAYNAGPGAVAQYNGVPPYKETRNYIQKVKGYWKEFPGQDGAGISGGLGGAQTGAMGPQMDSTELSNQINRINYAYMDSPDAGKPHIDKLMNQYQMSGNASGAGMPGSYSAYNDPGGDGKGFFKTPNGIVRGRLPGESQLDFMLRLGRVGFGLVNDPGNAQTTGGNHVANSLHYQGLAVDWGNGRNPADRLQQFYDWASQRPGALGTQELIWQAPGHYDHLHWGTSPSAPPRIKPINTSRRPRKRTS